MSKFVMGIVLFKQQPAKKRCGHREDAELRVFQADLYSACVCNLRVTDWWSESSIDCSEDVIEAGVIGSRT